MLKEDKLYKIWVYLQAEPLFWITLTLGAYLVGDYLYKKSKLNPLVNPVAISILIVSSVLLMLDVSYDRYFNGAKFINFKRNKTNNFFNIFRNTVCNISYFLFGKIF